MKPNIILASNSPRRKELLKAAGIAFTVQSKNVSETHPEGVIPADIPLHLARKKARAFADEISVDDIVIGADTIVILRDKIFEKPTNRAEAVSMLQQLSGETHTVITGVCVMSKEKEVAFSCTTLVTFNSLSDTEIEYYVDTFQPYDKAGAYACQEWIGAVAIHRFEGDYFNVVGLPVNDVYRVLKNDFGLALPC